MIRGEPTEMPGPLTKLLRDQARRRRPHTLGNCYACGRPVATTVRFSAGTEVYLCPGGRCERPAG